MEAKAGVLSLDELQGKRHQLVAKLAKLEARHGPAGVFDAYRRALRGSIAHELRQSWDVATLGRPTKDALEDAACGDPRYREALAVAEEEVIEMVLLKNQITEITEAIQDRHQTLYAWASEARLTR